MKRYLIVASRGRNPERPTDRTAGLPTEQRLEVQWGGLLQHYNFRPKGQPCTGGYRCTSSRQLKQEKSGWNLGGGRPFLSNEQDTQRQSKGGRTNLPDSDRRKQ